ncbi:hypothetical protein H671_3g10443 [Cricetulus griseus]|nr:hypothetical protein H671_3g10443 [Cricetulus griseus]
MLLALGALPGNSRIPMGSGSEWPRAPRVEPEEQRPELLTAAARVRKPELTLNKKREFTDMESNKDGRHEVTSMQDFGT